MRDWSIAFRPASFRGVFFRVASEDMAGGRRLGVTPISYSDKSVIEDMGRDPHGFSLTAYLVSDDADRQSLALERVLALKGAGTLVLPMRGRVRARSVSWSRSRSKDQAGYVAFDLQFIEDGLSFAPFGFAPGVAILAALAEAGATLIGLALAANYGKNAWTRDANRASCASIAARAVFVIGQAQEKAPQEALAAMKAKAVNVDKDIEGFGSSMMRAWRAFALAGDAADAARALETEIAKPADNEAGIAEQACLAAALALAGSRRDFLAQQDAARARESMAAIVAPVIERAAVLGMDVFEWLTGLTGEAALDLSRIAADRAPLVRVETGVSMSAARLAFDLYGDPARARELAQRNKAPAPCFMPVIFEALSA